MKIKGRNIINTSQYSFIRTAHETKLIFLFDLILYVRLIIDLLRCLFDMVPCDSQMKKWTLHSITGAHIKWFKNRLGDLQKRCQWKNIIIKCRCFWKDSVRFILCEQYNTKGIYLQTWKTVTWRGLMGCRAQAGLHELLEVWGEKEKHVYLYKQRRNQEERESWCYDKL